MVAMGGIGSIRMLSSASAPSRVPQVVCQRVLVEAWWAPCAGQPTYLCDGDAGVQLDEIVEIAKCDRDRDETDVARVS